MSFYTTETLLLHMTNPPVFLDPTISSRWDLEPAYPEVTASDQLKIDALQTELARGPIVHDLHGVKVGVDAGLHPYLSYLVINDAYEAGDLRLIRDHVEPGDRAVVLGAGMGVIAAALGLRTGASVLCVDANPDVETYVALTAGLNGADLPFMHGAVVPGQDEGQISFALSEQFWASSLRADTYLFSKLISVPVVNLKKLLLMPPTNTLFVDIEGAEVGLFSDAVLPATIKKLFVEVHRPALAPKQWASIFNDLHALGFELQDCQGLTHYWAR